MKKVMFVCTGNTCRSPMAEYFLKDFIKKAEITDIKVTSAGLKAEEGSVVCKKATTALKAYGIVVRRFKPKRTTTELCAKQNAIICMTQNQKKYFVGFNNVYTVDELTGVGEILDPYGQSQQVYDDCAKQLKVACEKIFKLLIKE